MFNEDSVVEAGSPADRAPRRPGAPLRVGIAGAGFMARVHAHAARVAGAVVVGAAGSTPSRAEAARDAAGAIRGYEDVAQMLEVADLDVLHVCAPNTLHFEFAAAAAAQGVHVVCEKPLTATSREAVELVDFVRAAGVTGSVPFVYRFHPMVRELAQRLQSGQAGAVGLVSGHYLQDWLADADATNWRVDAAAGGRSRAFADIGSHWFDLLEFVRGIRVSRVSARFATVFATRASGAPVVTEDSCTVQFEMADGVIGVFAASQVARGRKNQLTIEISGDHHSYSFDQEKPESLWVGTEEGSLMVRRDPATLSADASRLAVLPAGHAQGYQDCFNAFVADAYASVAGRPVHGLPTFEDGLRSVRIVDAVVESAALEGSWITIPREDMDQ